MRIYKLILFLLLASAASAQAPQQFGWKDYSFLWRVNVSGKGVLHATHPSAAFEVGDDNSKLGFLPPRGYKDSVVLPALGLQIYDIPTKKNWYYDGTSWQMFGEKVDSLLYATRNWVSQNFQPKGTYLTSFTESDPTVGSHIKAITTNNISNWNTAYGWGNHAGLYRPISYVPAWSEITGKPTIDDRQLQTLTYGVTTTFNVATSYEAVVTLTGNTTLSITNLPSDGKVHYLTLAITQDATGGRTVTWPASVKWPGGTAPTLTTTGGKKDVITFRWNGTELQGAYKLNY